MEKTDLDAIFDDWMILRRSFVRGIALDVYSLLNSYYFLL